MDVANPFRFAHVQNLNSVDDLEGQLAALQAQEQAAKAEWQHEANLRAAQLAAAQERMRELEKENAHLRSVGPMAPVELHDTLAKKDLEIAEKGMCVAEDLVETIAPYARAHAETDRRADGRVGLDATSS